MNEDIINDESKKVWEKPNILDLDFRKTQGGPSAGFDEGADYGTHSVP